MAYYTNFNLTVTTRDGSFFNEVERDVALEIAKKLCEISEWFCPADFDEIIERSNYPLEVLISSDNMKWYNHYDEMIALSKYFPSLYFELEGIGEEYGDIWREYFHNGEGKHSDAQIIFDAPDWE